MFRFENPDYLWMLVIIPLLLMAYAFYWRDRRRALDRFAERELLDRLAPGISQRRPWTKFLLIIVAIPLLTIAAANPQWSIQREEVKRRGIDLIIALDVSRSMLAEDVQPSRMERAAYFSQTLVDELVGNNIGVALFSCTALMQVPLTTDYSFVKTVIATAGPYQIGAQGTNIGEAIAVAEESFAEAGNNHRALVIISDGEDQEGGAANLASSAHDDGLLIYTVGVGKEEGAYMPLTLDNGNSDFVRDQSGRPARTSANFSTLSAIADAGGGRYYPLSSDAESLAEALRTQIDRIEKREFESQAFSSYDSFFYYFLAPALLLLLIEFSLGYQDRKKALEHEL